MLTSTEIDKKNTEYVDDESKKYHMHRESDNYKHEQQSLKKIDLIHNLFNLTLKLQCQSTI